MRMAEPWPLHVTQLSVSLCCPSRLNTRGPSELRAQPDDVSGLYGSLRRRVAAESDALWRRILTNAVDHFCGASRRQAGSLRKDTMDHARRPALISFHLSADPGAGAARRRLNSRTVCLEQPSHSDRFDFMGGKSLSRIWGVRPQLRAFCRIPGALRNSREAEQIALVVTGKWDRCSMTSCYRGRPNLATDGPGVPATPEFFGRRIKEDARFDISAVWCYAASFARSAAICRSVYYQLDSGRIQCAR